jgi:CheY-like chemotaxis protein
VLRLKAVDKGIEFKVELPPDSTNHYLGDSLRIRQILFNLVGNAVKFTRHGSVSVVVSELATGLRVEIRDTGVGIPEQAMDKLFTNFAQVDASTSRKFGGTGLGLAICKRLVEGMGGTIGVHSTLAQGSIFWIELPLAKATRDPTRTNSNFGELRQMQLIPPAGVPVAAESPSVVGAVASAAPSATSATEMGVLVVEDHPINQKLATVLLERMGFKVTLAVDGAKGVEAAALTQYAFILMDVQMPVLNGYEATRAIRAGAGPNAKTPIIALTANAMQGDKDACLAAGMDDFLTKPFSKEALADCIRRLVALPNPSANEAIGVPGA